jgi:hypothetical protein
VNRRTKEGLEHCGVQIAGHLLVSIVCANCSATKKAYQKYGALFHVAAFFLVAYFVMLKHNQGKYVLFPA